MTDREPDERLAAYVDGEMTERERARFEGELRVNQQLAAELAAYERTVLSVRSALQAPTRPVDLADRVLETVTAGPQRPTAAGSGSGGGGFGAGAGGGGGAGYRWFTSIAAAAALLVVAVLIHSLANELPLAPDSASVAQDAAPPSEGELNRYEPARREKVLDEAQFAAPSATPNVQVFDTQTAGSKDPDAKTAGSEQVEFRKTGAERAESADRKSVALDLERGSWANEQHEGGVEPRENAGSDRAKSTIGSGETAADPALYGRGPTDKVPGRRGAPGGVERPAAETNKGDVRLAQKDAEELPTAAKLRQAPPPTKAAKSGLSSANERRQELKEERGLGKADVTDKAAPVTRQFEQSRTARRIVVEPEAPAAGAAGGLQPGAVGKRDADDPAKKAEPEFDSVPPATPKTDEPKAAPVRTGSDDFFLGAARERRRAFRVPPTQVTLPFLQLTRTVAPIGLGGGAGAPERAAPRTQPKPNPKQASPRGGAAAPVGPVTGGPAGPATGGPSTPVPEGSGPSTPGPSTPGPSTPGPRSPGPAAPGAAARGSATPGPNTPGRRAARSSSVRSVSTRGFVAEQIAGSEAAVLALLALAEAAPDRTGKGRAGTPGRGRGRAPTSAGLTRLGERQFAGLELVDVTHWFAGRSRDRGSATVPSGATASSGVAPGERAWLVTGDRATVGRLMGELSSIARSASYGLRNGEVRVPVQDRAVAVRLGLPAAGGELEEALRDESPDSKPVRGGGGAEKAAPKPGAKTPAPAEDRMTLLLRFRTVATK